MVCLYGNLSDHGSVTGTPYTRLGGALLASRIHPEDLKLGNLACRHAAVFQCYVTELYDEKEPPAPPAIRARRQEAPVGAAASPGRVGAGEPGHARLVRLLL